jgi:hypothetical protein
MYCIILMYVFIFVLVTSDKKLRHALTLSVIRMSVILSHILL